MGCGVEDEGGGEAEIGGGCECDDSGWCVIGGEEEDEVGASGVCSEDVGGCHSEMMSGVENLFYDRKKHEKFKWEFW